MNSENKRKENAKTQHRPHKLQTNVIDAKKRHSTDNNRNNKVSVLTICILHLDCHRQINVTIRISNVDNQVSIRANNNAINMIRISCNTINKGNQNQMCIQESKEDLAI